MSLRLTSDDDALAASIAALAARHCLPANSRAQLDQLAAGARPECWKPLIDAGFLGMHLPEHAGGGGASMAELAVVVEAAGRAMVPGPFVPTLVAGLAVADSGGAAIQAFAPRLLEGAAAGCALSVEGLTAQQADGGIRLDGAADAVFGAPGADLLVLGARGDGGDVWCVVEAAEVVVEPASPVDLTRGIGRVRVADVHVPAGRVLTGLRTGRVRELAAVLLAAEASGVALWCFDTALAYVRIREQFGRPIGSFQAVKHKTANLFGRVQVINAAAWDAARSLTEDDDQRATAAAAAAIVCLPGARDAALESITLLGGIGFTWEHDISLYWRRATAAVQLLGRPQSWQRRLGTLASTTRRTFTVDADDPSFRAKVRTDLAYAATLEEPERLSWLGENGYVFPHYPPPYGLGATAVQQVVIGQELDRAELPQPRIFIAEFVLPTLLSYGTEEQRERFIAPTLRGDIRWCQLFSEPGAGSDLAALSTRAVRVEGGWRLTGQKVWNSNAHIAQWAICLARTDAEAPKHKGISYFLVDMASPGVEVRPLRQTTGEAEFNEVFLTDVFVPDDCLVGQLGEGWAITTSTLATERALIAAGSGSADALHALVDYVDAQPELATDPEVRATIGALTAEQIAMDAFNHRTVLRRLGGMKPGAEASVLKLAYTAHRQAVATTALELRGGSATAVDADSEPAVRLYLSLPAILIGGGTREIQLNVVAERVLGLPRG